MSVVKQIEVRTITSERARLFVKKVHYSGKVVPNSQVHFGAFLNGSLHGVLQFGPSMDKSKIQNMVADTGWNEFIELNRMAFDDTLPKNSESRVIGICLRMLRKKAPHLKWVISFADGTQCGDGTIYRASGFVLTQVKLNTTIIRLADGTIAANMTYSKGKHILGTGGAKKPEGATSLSGYMFRYIYFLKPECKKNLTVPIVPFSKIRAMGASMYKGKRVEHENNAVTFQDTESGAVPTNAHHASIVNE